MTPLTSEFEEGPARAAPRRFPFYNHRTLKGVMDGTQPPIDGPNYMRKEQYDRVKKLLRWMDE